jgi:hypothetical protein
MTALVAILLVPSFAAAQSEARTWWYYSFPGYRSYYGPSYFNHYAQPTGPLYYYGPVYSGYYSSGPTAYSYQNYTTYYYPAYGGYYYPGYTSYYYPQTVYYPSYGP